MNPARFVMVGDGDEQRLVAALLRLVRSRGWLAFYVRQVLNDFAAGRTPAPLAAVREAKRAQEQRRANPNTQRSENNDRKENCNGYES